MKKILIVVGVLLFGLAIVLLFVLRTRTTAPNQSFFSGTLPADGSKDISPTQQISISFTQPISANDVSFGIAPAVEYSTKVLGNTFVATPTNPLSAGVTYTVVVRYPFKAQNIQTESFSFTVAGIPPTLGSSPSVGANAARQSYLLQNYPDEFLANLTPYSDNYFSITSTFAAPVDTFKVVLSGNQSLAKGVFIAWLKSLGLTDAQIQKFNLTYVANASGGPPAGQHDTVLGNLIAKLPYAGQYFSLSYAYASSVFTLTLQSAYQQQGNQEFDLFLRANGIDDRSWLAPNLQTVVQ